MQNCYFDTELIFAKPKGKAKRPRTKKFFEEEITVSAVSVRGKTANPGETILFVRTVREDRQRWAALERAKAAINRGATLAVAGKAVEDFTFDPKFAKGGEHLVKGKTVRIKYYLTNTKRKTYRNISEVFPVRDGDAAETGNGQETAE